MDECGSEYNIFDFLLKKAIPPQHMGEILRQSDIEKLAGN